MTPWAEVPFRPPAVDPFAGKIAPAGIMARVFVGMPSYGQVHHRTAKACLQAVMDGDDSVAAWTFESLSMSLLAFCFNSLVCNALNSQAEQKWTHFALWHADIEPQAGWLNVMVSEMERTGADVLSAIAPIKDSRGLTSTGLRSPSTGKTRRLTMREVCQLPETFDAETAGAQADEILAVNTGLLLLRFDRPWVRKTDDNKRIPWAFTIRDGIEEVTPGRFGAGVWPEDWLFSTWAAQAGLRVLATRKVKLVHYDGNQGFANQEPWGSWDTERGDANA